MGGYKQTRILTPKEEDIDPTQFDCEWCEPRKKAEVRVPIKTKKKMPTGQSIYCCHEHKHLADQIAIR